MANKLLNLIKDRDIPDTFIPGCSSIEIIGDKRVVVENVKRVIEYQNERVRLDTDKFCVVIHGECFTLKSFSDRVIVVDGRVNNVSLE